jgi:glycosyltransferase involved in cell wall biosynthesis
MKWLISSDKIEPLPKAIQTGIKVAFIHNEKRIHAGMHTGAAQINRLMARTLATLGVQVRHFYPRHELTETPLHLKGLANILFFYSMLEYKDKILKFDIIQGTTYTPLPFLAFDVPVICHFGSTSLGYLNAVPRTQKLSKEDRRVFQELVKLSIIPELDLKTFRPLEDIADAERISALGATRCIATSKKVQSELVNMGIPVEKVPIIYNAIEDYWFESPREATIDKPHIVFLGRLGNDVFTLKLKGFSRLVNLYRAFPEIPKTTICMTTNRKLKDWLRVSFPKHFMYVNLRKDLIPGALAPHFGSILFLPSRYEGFSLSLVEGMSQGLVPISFSVGVAPEIIRNGENGFIVSTENEAEMRVREILTNDTKRVAMAIEAKKTAEKFRSENISKELLSLYHQVKSEYRQKNKNGNGGNKKPHVPDTITLDS